MRIFKHAPVIIGALFSLGLSAPAVAGWSLLPAGSPVETDGITVTPASDWNRASSRPGKQGRIWTKDGFELNAVEFFGGVPDGEPLYKERSVKHDPMPRFDTAMLAPELADFFERSFRVRNQITDFTMIEVKGAQFGGHQGIMLAYRYSLPGDRLKRQGVARLALVDKKLFLVNFYAPQLHYFPSALPEVEDLMDSARF